MRGWLILTALSLAACGPYPRDVEGTLDRIEQTHTIKVGFADMRQTDLATAAAFVARIAQVTGAKAAVDNGPAETQLARLETGKLDLVVGEFAEDTPWATDVSILEPLSGRTVGARQFGLSPVAANGENRWIALLEREIRDRPKQDPAA